MVRILTWLILSISPKYSDESEMDFKQIVRKHVIYAAILTLPSLPAQAAATLPNDCWFGVMAAEKAPHGQLVASGPVAQWRVGVPVVLYPTKEDYAQINALAEKGQTGTFDTSRPFTVVPTWISGPEPGDKGSGEEKDIQIMMKYLTAQGETGIVSLTYWTPISGSLPADQKARLAEFDQESHDNVCRGIP